MSCDINTVDVLILGIDFKFLDNYNLAIQGRQVLWISMYSKRRSVACAPLHRCSSNVYRMRRERSTCFNITTTSVRWSVHKFPKTTKTQRRASRQHQILTLFFRYANLGRDGPAYDWQLGYSPQGIWNKTRDHRRSNSWLVWYVSPSAQYICLLVRLYRLLLLPGLKVKSCGSGWPPTTLDGRSAGCCWRRSEVRSELRLDGH